MAYTIGPRLPNMTRPCEAQPLPSFSPAVGRRSTDDPAFEQRVVAAFMAEGYFTRHLKRMRALYVARRRALAEALSAIFGERIAVDLKPGGI